MSGSPTSNAELAALLQAYDSEHELDSIARSGVAAGASHDENGVAYASPASRPAGPRTIDYWTLREALERPELFAPPPAVLAPIAYAGRVTLISAREKMGKSTLMGQAVAALTNGAPLFPGLPVPDPAHVLWYAIDEPLGDAVRRLDRYGANPDSVTLSDVGPTAEELEAKIRETGARLVVIDTLANLWAGRLENDRDANAMTVFLRKYVEVTRRTGAALVLLYHTNKAGREYRGSVALGASVDAPLTLRPARIETTPAGSAAGADGDDLEEDDGRRVLVGRTRWGHVALRLAFDGERYGLGDDPAPLRVRVLWAVRDGAAASGKQLAALLHVRAERMLDLVNALTDEGLVTREGGGRGSLVLTPRGGIAADAPAMPVVDPGGGSGHAARGGAGTDTGRASREVADGVEPRGNRTGTGREPGGNPNGEPYGIVGSGVGALPPARGNHGGLPRVTDELI